MSGFSGSSDSKEFACSAGNPGLTLIEHKVQKVTDFI